MNIETKACPMCGETILADAKECKCCLEYFAINDESPESGFRNIYSKVEINVSRLVNTSKITNETTNIYRFIKRNEDVTLEEIIESFQINLPDLEVFLSRLIEAGFICKYDSGDDVVYSVENIDQKHKSEPGTSREIPNTKPDQDKLQKISTEEIDIIEPAKSITQDVDSKPGHASIHEFYSSINKSSNVDDVKLTQTSTTNIDDEINGSKSKQLLNQEKV